MARSANTRRKISAGLKRYYRSGGKVRSYTPAGKRKNFATYAKKKRTNRQLKATPYSRYASNNGKITLVITDGKKAKMASRPKRK